jgi:crotonobetaine/carnitine-CoA ligase
VISPLVAGCTASFELEFSPQAFIERAIEVGATKIGGIGAHALMILSYPPTELDRRHRVEAMFYAPCPAPVRDEMAERYGVLVTAKLYGQTECCPVTFSRLDDWSSDNPTSCGRSAPDLEVVILDDDDQPVPAGTPGEIVAKPLDPYALFAGYWDNDEATAKAFKGGWYHTGDAGIIHEDGTLSFVDRKKNVIRRRGENISSIELESAILTFEPVADVAVFAVQADMLEDEVMATITLREGASTTPEELFAFFKSNLPYFAVPRYVDLEGEIPRNALNRVMKHVLQERGITATTLDFTEMGLVVNRRERRGAAS